MKGAATRKLAPHVPLLMSYGGGHATMIMAIAAELKRRCEPFQLLGLTTAFAAFERADLEPLDISSLLDESDLPFLALVEPYLPSVGHTDISDEQNHAYFALGLRDLCEAMGEPDALAKLREQGRFAFEPVTAFERFFERIQPSCVTATTSPRFELAALKAAKRCGIPSIAVGDHFLMTEQAWIARDDYADIVTVMNDDVAQRLTASGVPAGKLKALGNPAFDALSPAPDDQQRRAELRAGLGLGDERLILWPLGGSTAEVAGHHLLGPGEVSRFLESLCERQTGTRYLMRPHPNWPVEPVSGKHGSLDQSLSAEDAILVADVICVESSTMGLQAVLRGKPVICLNFADYVHYPNYGWASKAGDLATIERLLKSDSFIQPPSQISDQIGTASAAIADLIVRSSSSVSV